MATSKGARVVAIRDSAGGSVNIFGFGTYTGDELPPTGCGVTHPCPRIQLDSGEVVWGFQCWWGPCRDEKELRRKWRGITKIKVVPLPLPFDA